MKFFTGNPGEMPDRNLATTETLKSFDEDVYYTEEEGGQLRLLVAGGVEVHPAFYDAVKKGLASNKKQTPATETKPQPPATETK